jgi:hypothetical protein
VLKENEALAVFTDNLNYTNIRIPIASKDKPVYIVNIDHNNSWFGSNPRIYVVTLYCLFIYVISKINHFKMM